MKQLLVGLLLSCNLLAQSINDRNIIYLHGYQGNEVSWKLYSELFETTRTCIPIVPEPYSTANGVLQASETAYAHITASMPTSDMRNQRNIVFAHSMGGLIARQIEQNVSNCETELQPFGGYIMAATPNKGTRITVALGNGEVSEFLHTTCLNISQPLLSLPSNLMATFTPFTTLNAEIIDALTGQAFDRVVCDFLIGWLDGSVKSIGGKELGSSYLAGLIEGNLSHFAPVEHHTGAYLQTLNTEWQKRPAVVFAGKETSPVHWRFLASGQNNPSKLPLHASPNDVSGGREQLWEIMQQIEMGYDVAANIMEMYAYFNLFFNSESLEAMVALQTAKEFEVAKDWIRDSETPWNVMIGASRTEQVTAKLPRLSGTTAFDFSRKTMQDIQDYETTLLQLSTETTCWVEDNYTYTQYIHEASDGLVPVSRTGLPDSSVPVFEVEGANHQELRNHANATVQYAHVFDGDGSMAGVMVNPFFTMPEK